MKYVLMFESFKNLSAMDRGFLPFIRSGVEQYLEADDQRAKRKLKEGIKTLIMKWTDRPVEMVSEEAMRIAQSVGLDAFDLLWPQRNKAGRDTKGKSLLVWEHTTPVEELFQQFVTDPENLEKHMADYSGVCWISREENDKLDKKFRSKRPGGWRKVYDSLGIKVIDRK